MVQLAAGIRSRHRRRITAAHSPAAGKRLICFFGSCRHGRHRSQFRCELSAFVHPPAVIASPVIDPCSAANSVVVGQHSDLCFGGLRQIDLVFPQIDLQCGSVTSYLLHQPSEFPSLDLHDRRADPLCRIPMIRCCDELRTSRRSPSSRPLGSEDSEICFCAYGPRKG